MELWSALSYQSQDYSSATHVGVGTSQLVNAGVGGLIVSAESQDQELLARVYDRERISNVGIL